MTNRRVVAALAVGVAMLGVPSARADLPPVRGLGCGFSSTDKTELTGQWTSTIYAGPLVVDSPTPTNKIKLICSLRIGTDSYTAQRIDAGESTEVAGVASIPPTPFGYAAPQGADIYMCMELETRDEQGNLIEHLYYDYVPVDPRNPDTVTSGGFKPSSVEARCGIARCELADFCAHPPTIVTKLPSQNRSRRSGETAR